MGQETGQVMRRGYKPELDGLRGFAVSFVWLSHLDAVHFRNGVIGVDIFFVLSGYLITGVLANEHDRYGSISFKNFYMRRILRLVPALWLLLAACLLWYAVEPRARPGMIGAVFASATYIMNFNRIFYWMGTGVLGHTWSLAIEEQFYILWPIALILVPWRFWLRTALVAAALSIAWRFALVGEGASIDRIYNGTDCRLDTILIGCACGLLGHDARRSLRPFLRHAFPVAVVAIVALLLAPDMGGALPISISITAVGLLTAIVILGLDARPSGAVFTNRPVILLGRCSYGIYLWHYPLLAAMAVYGLTGWWTLLNIPITLAVSGASFVWLERPILKRKAAFERTDPAANRPVTP